jgi:DNA polymerase I-like protein with 3'-5' exonuclease and polymerase domains
MEAEAALRAGGDRVEVAGPAGQALLDRFHEAVPYVRELAKKAAARAGEVGYVVTAGGRRCRFPRTSKGFEWTHKALNRIIQGSSGDQIRKAMVDADGAGLAIQLQVHDEIDMTIRDRKEAALLGEIIEQALPCRVPHRADVEIGPSWGEVRK